MIINHTQQLKLTSRIKKILYYGVIRKVWIHFTESNKILMECDISDGSGVEVNIEEI